MAAAVQRRSSVTNIERLGSPSLKSLNDSLVSLPPQRVAETEALLLALAQGDWEPIPNSPQEAALRSPADIIGFGGAAGGGKSDLLIGAAVTQHWRSVIYRRELTQLAALETRSLEVLAGRSRWNSQRRRHRIDDGRLLEFSAAERVDDVNKQQGHPRDFIGFDELCHFTEYQFRFLGAWNRTTRYGQRTRIIAAFNPPTDADGDWVITYFGPWLDKRHPRPAKPGELRWYAMLAGVDTAVRNGNEFEWTYKDGTKEWITPKSRTFFPSKVEDNPYLMVTGYRATLQQLPEPLRSLMLQGAFDVAQQDHQWQVIPTEWVVKAQARWKQLDKKQRGSMSQLGVDVARGGRDNSTYAARYGTWFDRVIKRPGKQTPDGQSIVSDIIVVLDGADAPAHIDVIGVGSSPVDIARMYKVKVVPMNASMASFATDKSKKLRFVNRRAEWIWKLREALDPGVPEDEALALPPDREVLADLCAPRYELKARGIQIESKEDIKERIKRSPDVGEAIINAHGQMSDGAVLAGAIVVSSGPRIVPGA